MSHAFPKAPAPQVEVEQANAEHGVQMGLIKAARDALGSGGENPCELVVQLYDYTEMHFMSEALLMRLLAPRARTPSLILMSPVCVLLAFKLRVPLPSFISVLVPEMTPVCVSVSPVSTLTAAALLLIRMSREFVNEPVTRKVPAPS